ncbi:hypothetical protein [Streptomyces sp. NPDC047042]|uniref:hypothetical protein n=1 Tax=Streptomyces sp. NPDC047042 TaxID=3154807 RepID=UPI0034038091
MTQHSQRPHGATPATVIQNLTDHGVPLPIDLPSRLDRLIAPSKVTDLEGRPSAGRLVAAYCAIKQNQNRTNEPDAVWIVLYSLFSELFARHTPGLPEALKAERLGLLRTRIEIGLRIGGRCFHLGRELLRVDGESEPGQFLLSESVRQLTWVRDTENRLNDHTRRKYFGQLSAAQVILSRRVTVAADVEGLLRGAARLSLEAQELGDTTEEHYAYQAEIGLRLYDVTRDVAHLEQARASATTPAETDRTKRLRAAAADALAHHGYFLVRAGELTAGLVLLRQAEDEYTAALDLVEPAGTQDGYLAAKRAQLRYHRYRVDVDRNGRRTTELLDLALDDWLRPDAEAHSTANTIIHALLDRARVRARRNDRDGAAADHARARALLESGAPSMVETKLRVTELEQAVDAALKADDLPRLAALVADIADTPVDAPIPAAALVQATKVLAGHMTEGDERGDEWHALLSQALDRLEIDLEHPTHTPASRHRTAGHAALMAWFLARRAGTTEELARTIQLYRLSFDAVDTTPSVDAQANAGACALKLAKKLLAGDAADAEEALGLLTDGMAWLGSALRRAQENPTLARGDFDTTIAHSKLGESALRAYPLTSDPSLLELALVHLQTARDHGQDAVELTGLLGDAYYRRGTRNRDVDDLEQVLAFKDEAFSGAPEHAQRENRSVTAATVMRLAALTDEPGLLTDAALRALQATECDPNWPWAVMQLAALATSHQHLATATLLASRPEDLAAAVATGQRAKLLRRAAQLAVDNKEFGDSVLGGQARSGLRGVRVINDPHRLIEQSIVLKRLGGEEAREERDATVRFGEWLRQSSAPDNWTLPEPMAVIDVEDGDAVYVMRRSQGRVLGASALDRLRARDAGDPVPRFREALRYLAAFQAWRASPGAGGQALSVTCGEPERTAFAAQLTKAGRKFTLDERQRELLHTVCALFVADGSPAVAKKDPHPGNWLWTPRGDLVMIDIEATVALPLLQEAVTVIDDLPLLEMTPEGWERRHALAAEYVEALRDFGFPVDAGPSLVERYEAMAALHAVKGLGRLKHADLGVSSFALASRRLQEAHYRALLRHLSESATTSDVRDLAATFA